MAFFDALSLLPDDPIMQLPIAFAADTRPRKVNLGIGSYRDTEGRPLLLTSVEKAEKSLAEQSHYKDYGPIEGDNQFIQAALNMVYGPTFSQNFKGKLFAAQTLGGAGALRIGGEFLLEEKVKKVFISNPSWPNHKNIFVRAGCHVHPYKYYDHRTNNLDFSGMCSDVSAMPADSIILLQVNCHNPTGLDLSQAQWQELSSLIKKQKIIPFFDFAYQGFGSSIDDDAYPVRYFAEQGHEMLVSSSFSKNFGLYGERIGLLSLVCHQQEAAQRASSHIKQIIRASYSNPPQHGAHIVSKILLSDALKKEWTDELADMRLRLHEMRHTLVAGLQSVGGGYKDWNFLARQKGFFAFCGLQPSQVERLINEFAIYLPSDGRINVAGLNIYNMDYVINALVTVTQK